MKDKKENIFDLDVISKSEKKVEETKKRSLTPIEYEIRKNDSELVVMLKKLINKEELVFSDVYDVYGTTEGYNLIYSLRKGQLSWERFKKWMVVLGKTAEIVIKDKEE